MNIGPHLARRFEHPQLQQDFANVPMRMGYPMKLGSSSIPFPPFPPLPQNLEISQDPDSAIFHPFFLPLTRGPGPQSSIESQIGKYIKSRTYRFVLNL